MGGGRPFHLSVGFWVSVAIAVGGMVYAGLAGWGWMAVALVPATVLALVLAVNTVRVLVSEKRGGGEEDEA